MSIRQITDEERRLQEQVQALQFQHDELLEENTIVRAIGVQLRRELAWQVDLVEKCMVAMNENAEKGQAAEAVCKTLTEQLELERNTVHALSEQLESVRADAARYRLIRDQNAHVKIQNATNAELQAMKVGAK